MAENEGRPVVSLEAARAEIDALAPHRRAAFEKALAEGRKIEAIALLRRIRSGEDSAG
ncbi:MAG: hypothetical protein ACPGID_09275 [Rubricella sp.]